MIIDKTRYSIDKHDDKYCLFDRQQQGTLTPAKYVGFLTKKGSNYYLNDKKVVNLEKELLEYEKSLPYNVEYYCPRYRKWAFEEFVISNWLYNFGFKEDPTWVGDGFYFIDVKDALGITTKLEFSILNISAMDGDKDIEIRIFQTNTIWIQFICKKNADEFIKLMSSILNVRISSYVGNLLALTSDKVDFSNVTMNIVDSKKKTTSDFKGELKRKLQEIIDKL